MHPRAVGITGGSISSFEGGMQSSIGSEGEPISMVSSYKYLGYIVDGVYLELTGRWRIAGKRKC